MLQLVHKVTTRLRRSMLRLMRASTVGVRALVVDDNDQLLLVRHTYRPGWFLPGGEVELGETAETAVVRELREEAGVTVIGRPELFGVYHNVFMGVNDYPIVYIVRNYEMSINSSPEIAEVGWFAPTALPPETTDGTRRRAQELIAGIVKAATWA